MWTVCAAHPRHINRVARSMRDMDRIELAAFGHDPKTALRRALRASALSWVALNDGVPEALFGLRVVSLVGGVGQPWLLATDRFYAGRRALLRLSPGFVAAMQRETPILENMVAAQNVASIRYLSRLGFDIAPDLVQIGGTDFYRFSKGA